MFSNKSTTLQTRVEQYRVCRNKSCGKKFFCHQAPTPPPIIIREIDTDEGEISDDGNRALTIRRVSA